MKDEDVYNGIYSQAAGKPIGNVCYVLMVCLSRLIYALLIEKVIEERTVRWIITGILPKEA
jgi:hypothetical protein